MEKYCAVCAHVYLEISQSSICPHEQIRDSEMQARWEAGCRLLGNQVRLKGMPRGLSARCLAVLFNGTVMIEGLTGEYDPEMLELAGRVMAVPMLGTVN